MMELSLQARTVAAKQFIEQHEQDIRSLVDENVDAVVRMGALQHFRRILSAADEPPYQEFIDGGLVPIFIPFLRSPIVQEQFEGAWIITNLLSGTSEQTVAVVGYGVEDILLELTQSQEVNVIEQSLWGLGNIAGDCKRLRDTVVAKGIIPRLIEVIEQYYLTHPDKNIKSLFRTVAWVLTSVFRPINQSSLEDTKLALPSFAKLLGYADDSVINDTCWSMVYLCETSADHVRLILDDTELSIVQTLLTFLKQPYPRQKPILRVLSAIITFLGVNNSHYEAAKDIFEAVKFCCYRNNHRHTIRVMLFPPLLTAYYHRDNNSLAFKEQIKNLLLAMFGNIPDNYQLLPPNRFEDADGRLKEATLLPDYTISYDYYEASNQRQEYWKIFLLSTVAELSEESSFPRNKCLAILTNNRIL